MAVTPASASVPLGTLQQYTAVGTYSDGGTEDLTSSANWSSTVQSVASIGNNTGTKGLATTVATGSTTISAISGTTSGSTSLTVMPAVLSTIDVTPASPSTSVAKTLQFTSTGHYSDGTTQPITGSVTWSSSLPAVATISNASGSQGLATAVANGSTTITATMSGVNGSTNLKVSDTPCVGPCVLTFHVNLSRDGVVLNETTLAPGNVTSSTFGRLGSVAGLNGQIYTQPLYMSGLYSASAQGNLVFVATEKDWAYAINADPPYQIVWGGSYIPDTESPQLSGPGLDLACTNITPSVGITGTPVIDPNTRFNADPVMYFVTSSVDASKAYHQRLHAVDVVTGNEVLGGPVEIKTPVTSPLPFDPLYENQRSGLALTYDANGNPQIYIEWGAHCIDGGYHGWMMKYTVSAAGLSTAPAAYFLSTQGNGTGAGLWMSGGAPAIDNSINGNLYVVSGNGTYDGNLNHGESIIKLTSNLTVSDWYTPNEWKCLNGIVGIAPCSGDFDFGSGGTVLFNVPNGVPELVAAGKRGEFYVDYQSNLGHLDPIAPPSDYSFQTCTTGPPYPTGNQSNIAQCFRGIQSIQGVGPTGSRSTPVFWNSTLYTGGSGDAIRAFPLTSTAAIGTFDTTGASASSPTYFTYPGSALTLSWNGTNPATGLLWSLQPSGYNMTPIEPAVLRAYSPIPSGTSLNLLYQSSVGPGAIKFQVPTIANGKVFVAGQGVSGNPNEGQLYVFGLCPCN